MLPSKFGVNWPFGSGEEAKNRFSRWRPWWPSWISALAYPRIISLIQNEACAVSQITMMDRQTVTKISGNFCVMFGEAE